MISPDEFAEATNYRPSRSLRTGFRKSSSALAAIYDDLVKLQNLPKTNLEARWTLLGQLAIKADAYMSNKKRRNEDVNSAKYAAIERLSSSAFGQLAKEKRSAQKHHTAMLGSGRGITPGANNPHHKNVRFEKAVLLSKGPNAGMTFNGHDLYDNAAQNGVNFTGDEMMDAYKLRAYFKANSTKIATDLGMDLLQFLNSDQERLPYRLSFSNSKVLQNGSALSTKGGMDNWQDCCMCVVDPDGNWHASKGKSTTGGWHHSSFLAGGDAMFAGTIGVSPAGTPQYITNASGHYSPQLDDILKAIESLRTKGLPTSVLSKMSVGYQDYGNDFGGKEYCFPLLQFGSTGKRFPNPQLYEIKTLVGRRPAWLNAAAKRHWNSPGTASDGVIAFPV